VPTTIPQLPNHAVVEYEIAARVGFSQVHVSRLQPRALARMRTQLIEP
jgi:DNA-directed RNA polymerase specialized sigma subunit